MPALYLHNVPPDTTPYRVTKDDSSYEWICEGRHPVPAQPNDKSYKLPRFPTLRKGRDITRPVEKIQDVELNLRPVAC